MSGNSLGWGAGVGKDTNSNENETCDFEIEPDTWREKYGRPPTGGGEYSCDESPIDGSNYCEFHVEKSSKYEPDVDEEEVFKKLLNRSSEPEKNDIVGAKFDRVDIYSDHDLTNHKDEIVLLSPVINKLELKNASLSNKIEVKRGIINNFSINDSKISGNLIINQTNISRFELLMATINNLTIENSNFPDTFYAYKTEFDSEVELINFGIGDDFVIWRSEFLDDFTFKPDTVNGVAMIVDNTISHINCKPSPPPEDGSLLIRMDDSNIEDGHLSQPETSSFETLTLQRRIKEKLGYPQKTNSDDVLYDLRHVSLGDVNIHTNKMGLYNYYFYYTSFDGFDTIAHQGQFENINWDLHKWNRKFNNHTDYQVAETRFGAPDCTEYPKRMKLRHHRETYVPATTGAEDQGDNVSASKFFRREARARKLINRTQVLSPNPRHQTSRRQYFYRYIKDFVLQYSCNYGESPSRTFLVSILAIFTFSIIYPLTEVNELPSHSFSLSNLMGPRMGFYDIDILIESFQFSTATFVTLGISKFEAGSSTARGLMVVEALLGSFLVGLFIFSLGRSMKR